METAAISLLQQHGTKVICEPAKKEEAIRTAENSTSGFAHGNHSNSDMRLAQLFLPDTRHTCDNFLFPAGPPL